MAAYITRRLLWALIILLLLTVVVFFAMRLLPGDPLMIYVAQSQISNIGQEALEQMRHDYGLDRPMIVQYFDWAGNVLKGNLGKSIFYNDNVGALMKARFPITGQIGITAFVIATILGTLTGLMAGLRRGKITDQLITPLAYIGITIPVFWLGIMMVYLFGVKLHWLPIGGYTSPFENFWLNAKQLIMPVACESVLGLASMSRQMRSSVLEVASQDYIRTAWSKGLSERIIVVRHMLKNSLIPIITLMGFAVGSIFGGSVLIETVFNIPGMGRLMVNSIFNQDYVVVQASTLIFGTIVLLVNLIVDMSYGWLDPRIRYS
jgi:peptide/nickel transport system permease protein